VMLVWEVTFNLFILEDSDKETFLMIIELLTTSFYSTVYSFLVSFMAD
jgi:hypothetical protein